MKSLKPPERLKPLKRLLIKSRILMIPVPVASILLSSVIAMNTTTSNASSASSAKMSENSITTMLLFGAS